MASGATLAALAGHRTSARLDAGTITVDLTRRAGGGTACTHSWAATTTVIAGLSACTVIGMTRGRTIRSASASHGGANTTRNTTEAVVSASKLSVNTALLEVRWFVAGLRTSRVIGVAGSTGMGSTRARCAGMHTTRDRASAISTAGHTAGNTACTRRSRHG